MPTLSRREVLARAAAIAATQLLRGSSLIRAALPAAAGENSPIPLNVSVPWNQTVAIVS